MILMGETASDAQSAKQLSPRLLQTYQLCLSAALVSEATLDWNSMIIIVIYRHRGKTFPYFYKFMVVLASFTLEVCCCVETAVMRPYGLRPGVIASM